MNKSSILKIFFTTLQIGFTLFLSLLMLILWTDFITDNSIPYIERLVILAAILTYYIVQLFLSIIKGMKSYKNQLFSNMVLWFIYTVVLIFLILGNLYSLMFYSGIFGHATG